MTQSLINTLFSTPAASPTSSAATNAANNAKQQAQGAGTAAQSFGNVLSRELNGRATQSSRPEVQNKNGSAEAANARARQQQQRAGERQQTSAAARQGNTNTQTTNASAAKNTATKQPTDITKSDTRDAAAIEKEEETFLQNTASAELLALVGSLTQKSATSDGTAPNDATGDTATTVAGASDGTIALTDPNAKLDAMPDDAAQAGDAAFEAMLAAAAQTTQTGQTALAARSAQNAGVISTSDLQTVRPGAEVGRANFSDALALASADDSAMSAKLETMPATFAAGVITGANVSTATDPTLLTGLPGTAAGLASNVLSATNPAPSDKLTPFVGTSAWDQALGQKVVWMAAGAQQTASLTLNPPDLGPLQVVINVNNAHAEASFTADQPEVRQALEAALPKLKEMLADAGISLGQASVNAGTPNQHGGGSQHTAGTDRERGGKSATVDTTEAAPVMRSARNAGGSGLVDTFA
ncbi:MAG: flagellar hook-length control protein FliK [Pseudomonadota bacterium]